MSLTRAPWELSNPPARRRLVTVIVIVMITWPTLGDLIGAYADAAAVAAMLITTCVQQRSTATQATVLVRYRLSGA